MTARAISENRKRLVIAAIAYVLLGLLIWSTMSNAPIGIGGGQISIRGLTLAIVAFFAVRTLLHWKAQEVKSEDEE